MYAEVRVVVSETQPSFATRVDEALFLIISNTLWLTSKEPFAGLK
jgi:hypothetical protein